MGSGTELAGEVASEKINKDFFCMSMDGKRSTLGLIKAGKYTVTLGVDPKRMGYAVIDATAP